VGRTAENRDAWDRSDGLHNGVLRLVLFLIEEQRYALSVAAVQRVLPMVAVSPLPHAPPITLGVINLRGAVVPVLDIRRRFGRPAHDYGLGGHLLVARTPRHTVALPVDAVLGVREVTAAEVTPPAALLPGIGYVSGVVALADGVLYLHDLDEFLSLNEEAELGAALVESDA
jgi:purine-binding chemotaxis protein CheW